MLATYIDLRRPHNDNAMIHTRMCLCVLCDCSSYVPSLFTMFYVFFGCLCNEDNKRQTGSKSTLHINVREENK